MKTYTQEQVRGIIRKRQNGRSLRQLCGDFGVSQTYIHNVLSGISTPSVKILSVLGLKKIKTVQISYVEAKSNGNTK